MRFRHQRQPTRIIGTFRSASQLLRLIFQALPFQVAVTAEKQLEVRLMAIES